MSSLRPPVRLAAAGAVVGPLAFIGAWSTLGANAPAYSPVHDAISRLARSGADTRVPMTAGLVALAAGISSFALVLREKVPGPAWICSAITGAVTFGVAAVPLGSPGRDDVHGVLATVGYAALAATPATASLPLARLGLRHWAVVSAAAGAVSAVCLTATIAAPARGLFQRVGLTATHIWVVSTAVAVLRKKIP